MSTGRGPRRAGLARAATALAVAALALAVALVFFSAYVRHLNSGLEPGAEAPAYGAIGTVERPVSRAPAWVTEARRAMASGLALVALALLALAAWQRGRQAWPPLIALAVIVVALASLGPWSASLHYPAVVAANGFGGFLLVLAALWLLVARGEWARVGASAGPPELRPWARLALGLVAAQAVGGFLVSANFAGLACDALPGCGAPWSPGADLARAWAPLTVGAAGVVERAGDLGGLHMAHRLLAVAVGLALVALAVWAWRCGFRLWGVGLAALVAAAAVSGALAVRTGLDLRVVLTHHAVALALLAWLVPASVADVPREGAGAASGDA